MSKYVLLDNAYFLEYFHMNMAKTHIPIVLNDHLRALLDARRVRSLSLLDYINYGELGDIVLRAFSSADRLMDRIDKENADKYSDIFGTKDIRLLPNTIGYLFKRLLVASLKVTKGMENIMKDQRVDEINYIHDGAERYLCGTASGRMRAFFFRDDITWNILENWRIQGKPGIEFKRVPRRSLRLPVKKGVRMRCGESIISARTLLSPVKQSLLGRRKRPNIYASGKRTLLFLSPIYDLRYIASSDELRDYNVIIWDAEDGIDIKEGHPGTLSFNAEGIEDNLIPELDIKKIALPILQRFYNAKMGDILHYWDVARFLSENNDIRAVLWGSCPHKYPRGMIKEYFRLRGVPVIGMQHGGSYGSNDKRNTEFETDYRHCDHFLSYGYVYDDLYRGGGAKAPSIIPVGSPALEHFESEHKEVARTGKKKVDVIFPIFFSGTEYYYESELFNPRLFTFQRKVVDLLANYAGKKIILKFPFGTSMENALRVYVESTYPNKFMVVSNMSFTDCLKRYEADAIIIEEQSSPLYEALATASDIIVYNNPEWNTLTERAYELLNKRATICDTETEFLEKVENALKGKREIKDMGNREFWRRYCVHDGNCEENMINAVYSVVNERIKEDKAVYAHR